MNAGALFRLQLGLSLLMLMGVLTAPAAGQGPNILIAISEDQSYPYALAYGTTTVQTPSFDRVAREGVLLATRG